MRWSKAAEPAVITSAPVSPDYEFSHRRRRYTMLMLLRIVCLLAAVSVYEFSLWLAVALVVGGAILPWCAVLIANDGPPRRRRPGLRPVVATTPPQLPPTATTDRFDGGAIGGTIRP
jgi:hypothetical protein